MTNMQQLEFVEATHIGSRDSNDDYYIHVLDKKGALFAVADGLGAYQAGYMASQAFCQSLASLVQSQTDQLYDNPIRGLHHLINRSSEEMVARINAHDHLNVMPQTTCVIAWITDHDLISAHVGDSRLYLLDAKQVIWRTRDHSIAQLLVAQGEIKEEDINEDPTQSRLYRSIGGAKPIKPSITRLSTLKQNQGVLLCSDGFWTSVQEKELLALVKSTNMQVEFEGLIALAVKRASPSDNVTAQFIRMA